MKRILILEDEEEVAQLYAKRLKDRRYDPSLAFDGLQGLKKLRSFKPDLILLDINMPHMGGLEFYQHICDPYGKPQYPVLVLTGRADLEKLFKDFYVEGILIKPFSGPTLAKEVDIILDKSYWVKTDGSAKRVVIVDDDQEAVKDILAVFTQAGYKADIAVDGVEGIEKIMADPPDLAMVKLGLADISGDLVILRLQQIAKTRKTSTVLYVPKKFQLDIFVMQQLAQKRGVAQLLEYGHPQELLNAAIGVFRQLEQES